MTKFKYLKFQSPTIDISLQDYNIV